MRHGGGGAERKPERRSERAAKEAPARSERQLRREACAEPLHQHPEGGARAAAHPKMRLDLTAVGEGSSLR